MIAARSISRWSEVHKPKDDLSKYVVVPGHIIDAPIIADLERDGHDELIIPVSYNFNEYVDLIGFLLSLINPFLKVTTSSMRSILASTSPTTSLAPSLYSIFAPSNSNGAYFLKSQRITANTRFVCQFCFPNMRSRCARPTFTARQR
jgi:hypothetical protein